MSDIERRPEAETAYSDHLQRSAAVWDRWSSWYGMSERDFEPLRVDLITHLDLDDGDRVLDIGCGPGVNFDAIRDAIGESGRLVAVDYSAEMVEQAASRIETHGWENVEVHRGDATTTELGGPYDAAIATLALSVMPDIDRAVRRVHAVLKPGASLGVLDLQEIQEGSGRVLNPVVRWFLHWYANWNREGDVRSAIERTFDETERLDTFMLGMGYSMTATRTAE